MPAIGRTRSTLLPTAMKVDNFDMWFEAILTWGLTISPAMILGGRVALLEEYRCIFVYLKTPNRFYASKS